MADLRKIASAMGGEVSGNRAIFPTPGHSAKDRGSWASIVPDAPDGVLIHSQNGGDALAIKDELRAKGVLPKFEPQGASWRVAGVYEFTDETGAVLYRTRRHERAGTPKRYTVERPDGRGGWIDKIGDARRVLYRLPELLAADPAEPVYLVEGERKADRLAAMGFTATAIAFGSKSWRKVYAEHLAGRTVAILPDNDEPGREFANKARGDIEAAGGKAYLVELPGLPPKGDIMDWDGTADDLRALVDKAAPGEDEDDWPALDLAACAVAKAPPREWMIDGWVPSNKATLMAGDGGVGKSLLAQMQATCVAFGRPFMGLDTRQANAAYVSWEDDGDELWRRQESICEVLGIQMAALAGRLSLVSYTEEEHPFLVTTDDNGVHVTPLGRKIERIVERHNVGFLILDNASQIAGVDHNAVDEVAPFAHWLGTLAKRRNGAVILLHHTNKAGQDFLGSVAYNNQFRSRLLLARPEDCPDPDVRVLTNPKANYGRAGNAIEIRWHNGAFVRDEDLPPSVAAQIRDVAQANADNDLFLACLDERNRQERTVSESPASRTYAPRVFAEMAESKRIGRDRMEAAMDRLFRIGAIERGFIYRDRAEGKDRFGLRRPSADPTADLPLTPSADIPLTTRRPPPAHPLYPTGISGAAHTAAPPDHDYGEDEGNDDGLDETSDDWWLRNGGGA